MQMSKVRNWESGKPAYLRGYDEGTYCHLEIQKKRVFPLYFARLFVHL